MGSNLKLSTFDARTGGIGVLTEDDFERLSSEYDLDEAAIRAIVEIEAKGTGFDSKGRPSALFEPHIAYRHSSGPIRQKLVDAGLAYQRWKRNYPKDSYPRIEKCAKIAGNEIACLATSWGLGQIMGFNHRRAGFATAEAMFFAFQKSEEAQLRGMLNFIVSSPNMLKAVRNRNWATFARHYNGAGYKANKYDTKLKEAYDKWANILARKRLGHDDYSPEDVVRNKSSKLLPAAQPRAADSLIREVLKEKINLVKNPVDRRNKIVVIGVRGYFENSMGKKGTNDRAVYDDAIFVVCPNEVTNYNANVDPSRYRKGIANLKADQAVEYKPGLHGYRRKNGPYPAFRQHGNCTVVRDKTGDDHGMFYINIHRGGYNTTSSAGCQTIHPYHWDSFKADLDAKLAFYKQETFQYILLDGSEFWALDAKIKARKKLKAPTPPLNSADAKDLREKGSRTIKNADKGSWLTGLGGLTAAIGAGNEIIKVAEEAGGLLERALPVLPFLLIGGVLFAAWWFFQNHKKIRVSEHNDGVNISRRDDVSTPEFDLIWGPSAPEKR